MLGNSGVTEHLASSQEEVCSMELVIRLIEYKIYLVQFLDGHIND
jgi:hypothetical protein